MTDARDWRSKIGHAVADEVQDWLADYRSSKPQIVRSVDPRLLAETIKADVFGGSWSPEIGSAVIAACRWAQEEAQGG